MIKTTAMLLEELRGYASPKTKISRMIEKGECFRIIRGLYETDPNVPAYLLAGSIYGPSYISFEFALADHGLIPEAVPTVTCASFAKKKKKRFETPFGTFTYRDVPEEAFPLCVESRREGEYRYRIASPEKALCDQLYKMSPVQNTKELAALLFEDLRTDESDLRNLDRNVIAALREKYHAANIRKLYTLLRRL